ncbi:hypothetical protein PQS90_06600 [Pseudomonas sp. BLCC-B13]|uniref:hypothetical protein n=1 Tax=Pseudomonas sp. BLCC-B13 TaxID=3025314 RepID=UPI00234F79F6|nr:hypothetical protein [Pseudomonas sp. BLCC-B13]MDC7824810.1 hypothetical protein [Pseudomonas sp. BLCC-B13]
MANTNPTPVTLRRAVYLCLLLLFRPKKFKEIESEENKLLNAEGTSNETTPRSSIVRRAFLYSALLVLLFCAIGFSLGLLLGNTLTCAKPWLISSLQIVGACVLLWRTLFVRGWEILSYGGVTLSERVNQWLYRFLYCIGTAVVVSSLSWPQCAVAS